MSKEETVHSGIIFVDKPLEWSSHDAVARMRRILKTRKVGHAGTLDPLATGLLTLGVGQSTRLLTHLVGLDKTYVATILLGVSTVSDDRGGEVLQTATKEELDAVTDEDVLREVRALTGEIEQIPSKVSAIKVQGKRAYDLVREGSEVQLKPRPVTIHSFDVTNISRDKETGQISLDATVRCSSGTYIRALARDLGAALGVHGHLTSLRRTAVGPFELSDHVGAKFPVSAVTGDELKEDEVSVPVTTAATIATALFPEVKLTEEEAVALLNGKRFAVKEEDCELVAATDPAGRLVGLAKILEGRLIAVTNFSRE